MLTGGHHDPGDTWGPGTPVVRSSQEGYFTGNVSDVSVTYTVQWGGSARQAQSWSYEAHLLNTTGDTLKLVGAVPGPGSSWVVSPPSTLAPNQSAYFDDASTLFEAGATVTYEDPATGGQVTVQGQANSIAGDSYSYSLGMNHLVAAGLQGYIRGVNPNVNVSYSISS